MLKDVLEETRRSFWGADTQTVDKFLNEMELNVPAHKQPKIAEPTAQELESLFRNGYTNVKSSTNLLGLKLMRKECRVEKTRISVAQRNELNRF